MTATRRRVCLDLTPLETVDRHGGIGRYALRLAERLEAAAARAGFDAEFFGVASSRGPVLPLSEARLAAARPGPEIRARRHRLRRRLLLGFALRRARLDLFHSTEPGAFPNFAGCPAVGTSYDVCALVYPNPFAKPGATVALARRRARLRRAYGALRRTVAISETTKRDLTAAVGLPADRIDVAPLGVESDAFAPAGPPGERDALRARRGLPERWFVTVGADHHRKNQRALFDAWARAAPEIVEGLVVVGRPLYGRVLADLAAEAADSPFLAPRFRWLGDVADAELPALYRHATAAVAPSRYEGFGMTLLEAMACGAPVLAARNDAYVEVGGEDVRLFDPGDVGAIAAALVEISRDSALRDRLRRGGLARAARFTWDRTADATVASYARALEGGP